MAESVHEQVVQAFTALLDGINGDGGTTYWFTALPVRSPAFHAGVLDSTIELNEAIYCFSPGQVEERPVNISIGMEALLTVDLAVAARFETDTENPFDQTPPIRWTVQTRLERDAKKRLRTNYNLLGASGAHRFTAIPFTDYAPDLTYLEGWAMVFLRVLLRYNYVDAAP